MVVMVVAEEVLEVMELEQMPEQEALLDFI
jgi:hypothetical protein